MAITLETAIALASEPVEAYAIISMHDNIGVVAVGGATPTFRADLPLLNWGQGTLAGPGPHPPALEAGSSTRGRCPDSPPVAMVGHISSHGLERRPASRNSRSISPCASIQVMGPSAGLAWAPAFKWRSRGSGRAVRSKRESKSTRVRMAHSCALWDLRFGKREAVQPHGQSGCGSDALASLGPGRGTKGLLLLAVPASFDGAPP